jgi:2-keto-3-deoxy-6-phosphogluconate aldolase
MPTGGMRIDNAREYLAAGPCAIGVGSNLFHTDLADASSDLISEHVGKWIEATSR